MIPSMGHKKIKVFPIGMLVYYSCEAQIAFASAFNVENSKPALSINKHLALILSMKSSSN